MHHRFWPGPALVALIVGLPLAGCSKTPSRYKAKCDQAVACQKLCDGGDPHGCRALADLYGDARGLPRNHGQQRELLEKACTGGDSSGCSGLAKLYEDATGVPKDQAKALEYRRRASLLHDKECDQGFVYSCHDLAHDYVLGRGGVARDEAKALELYQRIARAY